MKYRSCWMGERTRHPVDRGQQCPSHSICPTLRVMTESRPSHVQDSPEKLPYRLFYNLKIQRIQLVYDSRVQGSQEASSARAVKGKVISGVCRSDAGSVLVERVVVVGNNCELRNNTQREIDDQKKKCETREFPRMEVL